MKIRIKQIGKDNYTVERFIPPFFWVSILDLKPSTTSGIARATEIISRYLKNREKVSKVIKVLNYKLRDGKYELQVSKPLLHNTKKDGIYSTNLQGTLLFYKKYSGKWYNGRETIQSAQKEFRVCGTPQGDTEFIPVYVLNPPESESIPDGIYELLDSAKNILYSKRLSGIWYKPCATFISAKLEYRQEGADKFNSSIKQIRGAN